MKLILGTVQFGIHYGINNMNSIPDDHEISRIFDLAFKAGISGLDTAPEYGKAEERIAGFSQSRFKVITKFSKVSTSQELENALSKSLFRLNANSVYGYISHQADNLIENSKLWDTLMKMKENQKVEKIGYSLYMPEQLERLLDMCFLPDIVQLPYSVLDRKFEKYLPKLKQLGTEIHVRSVFLQGLYFMNPDSLPQNLQPLRKPLYKLHAICRESHLSIGSIALNFVNDNPNIDKLVIGVDSKTQLAENLSMIDHQNNKRINESLNEIIVSDKELLNPANW